MPTTIEADAVARELESDLRVTMAMLQDADDEVVELTLGMLPFGFRTALITYGALAPVSRHDEPNDDPVQVRLLPFGRYLINACVRKLSDEEKRQIDELTRDFEEAKARRSREET